MLVFISRHPTSCCSIAEVMSVLFFNTMKYTISEPRGANNDRFVLSKVFFNFIKWLSLNFCWGWKVISTLRLIIKSTLFLVPVQICHYCFGLPFGLQLSWNVHWWTLWYDWQGHAAPILYAAWAEAGLFPASDLLNLRKIDSDLEGHPTPVSNASYSCK